MTTTTLKFTVTVTVQDRDCAHDLRGIIYTALQDRLFEVGLVGSDFLPGDTKAIEVSEGQPTSNSPKPLDQTQRF